MQAERDELLLILDPAGRIEALTLLRTEGPGAAAIATQARQAGNFLALLPAPHRAPVQALLDELVLTRQPVSHGFRLAEPSASVDCNLAVLDSAAGETRIACVMHVAAPTGAATVDRFDQALSLARVAWFERDLATNIGVGSPSLAQIYGLEQARGPWHFDEIRERILPEDFELHADEIARSLQVRTDDLEARTMNYRIRRPDGTVRHLEVRYRNLYRQARPRAYGLVFDVTEAKQVEEQLLESRNWLNLALGSAGILLWEYEPATDTVRTSPNFGSFTGLNRARTLWSREALLDIIDDGSRGQFLAALRAWSTGDVASRPRFQVRGPHDSLRWVEASGNVEFGDDGAARRLYGVAWDVTAEVEQEHARKVSDERLARITNLVPGLVYQFRRDANGRYSMPYASDGITEVFAVTPAAVRHDASPVMNQVHPDDVGALVAGIEASAQALARWQHEFRILRPDGALRWLFGTAMPQREADDAVSWHGHIIDVTERHAAQQQLRESEMRLTLALSSARMSSWHWDLKTDRMKTTRALRNLLGLEDSSLPSATVFDLVHPDDVAAMHDSFASAAHAADDETFSVDYRFLYPDGEYRWVELRARAMRDEQGSIVAFDGVTSDITERRRAEAEREHMQRQLLQAQKMEAIGLLTGGIAHDFNNILASVLGYSGLALQRYGASNPPKLTEYLQEVIVAGERARDLVAQMLAFSRGESTEVVQVDVAPLVEQIMKMLRPTLPSSIDIDIDVASGLPPVHANLVQIQQVLLNLCINARDAMNTTGRIAVSAQRRSYSMADCASCHKSFSGDYVVLSVADDGIGIPESQRSRIFEPFFTTKTKQQGTGMGLATVHGIVHRHGGHIELSSRMMAGSTFSIALPLASAEPHAAPEPARGVAVLPKAVRPARILIVDDEPSIAHCTAEMLEIAGYTVEVETDSTQAARRLRAAPAQFDLLITDQTMPKLTGDQLALTVLAARPEFPVLLVSGHSAHVGERQAQAIGIRAFLHKPVTREALLQAVDAALAGSLAASA